MGALPVSCRPSPADGPRIFALKGMLDLIKIKE